ncbi:hypothetical protein TUM17382_33440 [Shewanella algae]|nr:hypothetical protein TUM17382_33440 [Shewanella algae]
MTKCDLNDAKKREITLESWYTIDTGNLKSNLSANTLVNALNCALRVRFKMV